MIPYRATIAIFLTLLLPRGCSSPESSTALTLKYKADGPSPVVLALYEAWFGHPEHISVGYSSHDSAVLARQIHKAQLMGISAFVIDWYGDRAGGQLAVAPEENVDDLAAGEVLDATGGIHDDDKICCCCCCCCCILS